MTGPGITRTNRLAGRVAVVTGGAGAGIGSATSRRLAADSASVVVADLDEERALTLAEELTAAGLVAVATRCDVRSFESVRAAVAFAVDRFGALDVLHSHAIGRSRRAYLSDLSVEEWEEGVQNVLHSAFYGVRAALPAMIEQRRGSIILTSSAAGLGGQRRGSIYSTSKSAVMTLAKCVATEYGSRNIRCNAIAPGVVGERTDEAVAAQTGHAAAADLVAQHALGRAIVASEVADLVAYLASDESSAITGAVLPVDAGYSAGFGDIWGFPPYD